VLIGTNYNLVDSKVAKQDGRYIVQDNTTLKNLVVSTTMLQPASQTNGHSHEGQEEVYIFTGGSGTMEIDDALFAVAAGDTILIEDGVFHKVYNNGSTILKFTCIFDGKRHTS
jgi:mannose-6-phosphate isomerase-like protein (cupin superfamily)